MHKNHPRYTFGSIGMLVPYRYLQHALALQEHRHFSRAAEALHITQPALSRSIQGLENLVGARLFDRGHGEVEATPIGLVVLDYARKAVLNAHDMQRAIALAKNAELGTLRIGAGPFAGAALIGPVLGHLSRKYPRLRVEVMFYAWQELPQRLRDRDIDLMLGNVDDTEGLDDLEISPLRPHAAVLVARAGHPLDGPEIPQKASDWLAYPWVGPHFPLRSARQFLGRVLGAEALQQWAGKLMTVVCDSHRVLQDVLVRSDAIAPLCLFMVADALRAGQLVVLPAPPLGDYGNFSVARLAARSQSAPEAAFIQTLQAWDEDTVAEEKRLLSSAMRRRRFRQRADAAANGESDP
ncbi:MAG: LysR family transcriptional regulator [Pseudacidovorax sp.]|nr:LysR family transcriptional regulator [Pseudacidovorax sp.]